MSNENNNVAGNIASVQHAQKVASQNPNQSQSGQNSKISDGKSAFAMLLRGLQQTQQNSSYFANLLANQNRGNFNVLNSFTFERAKPAVIERPTAQVDSARSRDRAHDNNDKRYDVKSRDESANTRPSTDDNHINRFDDYARQQPKRVESSSQEKTAYSQKTDNTNTKLDNTQTQDAPTTEKLSPLDKNNDAQTSNDDNIIVVNQAIEAKTTQTNEDLPEEVKDVIAFLSAMQSQYANMKTSGNQDQLLFDEAFLQTFNAQLTILLQNGNLVNNQDGLSSQAQLKALLGMDANMLDKAFHINMMQLLQQMQHTHGDVMMDNIMDKINPADLLKLLANQQQQATQNIGMIQDLIQQPNEKLSDLINGLASKLQQYTKANQTTQINIDMVAHDNGDIDMTILNKLSQMKDTNQNQKSDVKLNLNNNNPQQQKLAEILALTKGDGIKDYQVKSNNHDMMNGQQHKISDDILSQLNNIELVELPKELNKIRNEQSTAQTQNLQQSTRHLDMFAGQDAAFSNQDNQRQELSKILQALLQNRGKNQGDKITNNDGELLNQLSNNLSTGQKAKTTQDSTTLSLQPQQADNKTVSSQPMQILSADHKVSDDLKTNFADQLNKKPQTSSQDTQKMNEQIAVKIKQAINQQQDVIQFRLNPASLGRVEVQMDLSRDGILTASIVVERAETLDLLKQDQKQLIDALSALGFDIEHGGLEFGLDQSYNEGQGFKDLANQHNDDESQENSEESDEKQIIEDDILPFGADVAFNEDGSFSVRV